MMGNTYVKKKSGSGDVCLLKVEHKRRFGCNPSFEVFMLISLTDQHEDNSTLKKPMSFI